MFSITLKTEHGKTWIKSRDGAIPEGELNIQGDDNGNHIRIAVQQRDAHGQFQVRAEHRHERRDGEVPLSGYFTGTDFDTSPAHGVPDSEFPKMPPSEDRERVSERIMRETFSPKVIDPAPDEPIGLIDL